MSLLFFANQFGKNISKLSFVESEYFLAMNVSGQVQLNIINSIHSRIIIASPTQNR